MLIQYIHCHCFCVQTFFCKMEASVTFDDFVFSQCTENKYFFFNLEYSCRVIFAAHSTRKRYGYFYAWQLILFCQFDKQPNFLHFFQTQTLSFTVKLLLPPNFSQKIRKTSNDIQKLFLANSLQPSISSCPCEDISIAPSEIRPSRSPLENLISNCNNIKMEIVRKKNCFEFNSLRIQGLQKYVIQKWNNGK